MYKAAYAGNGLPATGLPAATSIALGLPSSGLALLLAPDGALPPSNLATLRTFKFNKWTSCWRIYSSWPVIKWRN